LKPAARSEILQRAGRTFEGFHNVQSAGNGGSGQAVKLRKREIQPDVEIFPGCENLSQAAEHVTFAAAPLR
jgi:hypothetical protein